MSKFIVSFLGGQYRDYWHKSEEITATTYRGLRRRVEQLRKKKAEYWDNWQGWHEPHAIVMCAGGGDSQIMDDFDRDVLLPKSEVGNTDYVVENYAIGKYNILNKSIGGIYISAAAKKCLL